MPRELRAGICKTEELCREHPMYILDNMYIICAELAEVVSLSRQKKKAKIQLGWNDETNADHNHVRGPDFYLSNVSAS